jgi:hypothetical protein
MEKVVRPGGNQSKRAATALALTFFAGIGMLSLNWNQALAAWHWGCYKSALQRFDAGTPTNALLPGLYEASGELLYDVGLPGKSGIGGGIVTVSPGKGGVGTFAPPLDAAGNSVKERLVAKFLSQSLGMDLFVSKPDAVHVSVRLAAPRKLQRQ